MSFNPITVTASSIVLQRYHSGAWINLDRAAGIAVTLPAAEGSGREYKFFVKTSVTSNAITIKVANATDVMKGVAVLAQDSADTGAIFETDSSSDTITMNGSTTGGLAGAQVTLVDVAEGVWAVNMHSAATGSEATPFSATVS